MHFMHPRRAQPARTIFVYLTLGLLTFVLGCQSTPEPNAAGEQALLRIQQGPTAERNEFGLHRVDLEEGQGILFVKGPRPHLEQFDGLGRISNSLMACSSNRSCSSRVMAVCPGNRRRRNALARVSPAH